MERIQFEPMAPDYERQARSVGSMGHCVEQLHISALCSRSAPIRVHPVCRPAPSECNGAACTEFRMVATMSSAKRVVCSMRFYTVRPFAMKNTWLRTRVSAVRIRPGAPFKSIS